MTSLYVHNASSPKPEAKDAKDLMMYSMRFCPFSQRVRVFLAQKSIPFSVYNIDLNSKPEWYGEKNPALTVPTIELDKFLINDSIVILEFLDSMYTKGGKLLPDEPFARAQQRILIEHASKITVPYYGFMHSDGDADKIEASKKGLEAGLQYFENKLAKQATPYFAGKDLGMIDIVLYPWFERFPMFSDERVLFDHKYDAVPKDQFPKLTEWHERMLTTKGVQDTVQDLDTHCGFVQTLIRGEPNYDFGLEPKSE